MAFFFASGQNMILFIQLLRPSERTKPKHLRTGEIKLGLGNFFKKLASVFNTKQDYAVSWPEKIVREEMEKDGWKFTTDPIHVPDIGITDAFKHVITPDGTLIDNTPASLPIKNTYIATIRATRDKLGLNKDNDLDGPSW